MRKAKKIFTRILLNNWGGIEHKIIELNEYINLFSGKSGSGKSTVMDAIQVVLYGSLASTFLNRAADDAKNKRSVLSYLRGEQKDGTANRENIDFCSQIVLEIEDTATHIINCAGITFQVGRKDQDIKRHSFFSHSGKIPKDAYLTEQGVPYDLKQIEDLVKERINSKHNRGRGDVNRMYPSKEAYLRTLNDVIFGYIDGTRFKTMEKSSIALKMTNGTSQFIRDYMFPKSKENTIDKISEQLGAYRDIKDKIDDLEERIHMLQEVQAQNVNLVKTRADVIRAEAIVRHIDIEGQKVRLGVKEEALQDIKNVMSELKKQKEELEDKQEEKNNRRIEVETKLRSSDYGQKEKERKEMELTISLLTGNSSSWRALKKGLSQWTEDSVVTDYVSNLAFQLIEKVQKGVVTVETCIELRNRLVETMEAIEEELEELDVDRREIGKELSEKKAIVDDLSHDRKPYKPNLKEARAKLEEELKLRYGRKIPVHILADLFDVEDEEWKNAIEGRLGRLKYSLITAPEQAHDAAVIFRKMRKYEEVELINSAAIQASNPKVQEHSLYEAVRTKESYVDFCLKHYLGRIIKCYSVEELEQVRDGVTPDCYSYSNFMFRHLRQRDYNLYACIGTKVSKAKLEELKEEVDTLSEALREINKNYDGLKRARSFEKLNQEPQQLVEWSKAAKDLERYFKKKEKLEKELQELKSGEYVTNLNEQRDRLKEEIEEHKKVCNQINGMLSQRIETKGKIESEISSLSESLSILLQGFVSNEALALEVQEELKRHSESAYRKEKKDEIERLRQLEKAYTQSRLEARTVFEHKYPTCGLPMSEEGNKAYDQALESYRKDYDVTYQEQLETKCQEVYLSLRDNVIASIHGEIKSAYRHTKEINRMLAKIKFSDSIYQIAVVPAENENGQFYEMLMAKELDSKGNDNQGFDGQISFGEDEFHQKYDEKIKLLTDKFTPPREADGTNPTLKKQEMEKYADYRNYLTFHMYEKTIDEHGNEKRNMVDDMAGRDSGGEGQNPKYVALMAGFAMLYMQQSNRDSRIKLVLLDEAFSKMDKERSEVCLRYARELELQLIVCVPDERLQSLIQNVDCVYGFRRFKNRISMMHIDKGDYLKLLEGGEEDEQEDDAYSESLRRRK